ncbi:MAG: hypothetical protein WD598_12055 [Acidimicrobiia bacterium]
MVVLSLGLVGAFATPAGASDKSAAKKLLLTKADVGSGYDSQPVLAGAPASAGAEDSARVALAQCVGTPVPDPTDRVVTADVAGLQFDSPAELVPDELHPKESISSIVTILKTKAMAAADFAFASDPQFPSCFAQLNIAANPLNSAVTAEPVPVKRYGSSTAAFRVSFIAQTSFGPTPGTLVFVAIRQGRAEILVIFGTLGQSRGFDPAETSVIAFDQTKMYEILDKLKPRLKRAPK